MQKPTYVSLYVDDIDYAQDSLTVNLNDSLNEKKIPLTKDTLMSFKFGNTKNLTDSLYRTDIIERLNNISDALYILHLKLDSAFKFKSAETSGIIVNKGDSSYVANSLPTKNDSLKALKSLSQNRTIVKTDTIYIKDTETIEKPSSQNVIKQGDVEDIQKQLAENNEAIEQLKNQLNASQQSKTISKTDNVDVEKIISQISNENNKEIKKQLVANNEAITELKNQLSATQLSKTITKTDTVFIKDTVAIAKPSSQNTIKQGEEESAQKELVAKNDTIKQLKNQLKAIPPPKTITITDTIVIVKEQNKIVDTTSIIAYYKMGGTVPETSTINQIINVLQNNNVQKIEISGFTDSSGNSYINKKITDNRIDYILSKISPFIPASKIYTQNFGDSLASINIVAEERRVEIKIHYKIKE